MHPIPKRQHFVPQLYLRQFAIEEQIFTYDKPSRRSFRTNIANVAVESLFYGFPNEMVDSIRDDFPDDIRQMLEGIDFRIVVEQWFHPLEDTIGILMPYLCHRLQTQRHFRLNSNEQEALAVFVAIQLLRTKAQRRFIVELVEKITAHWLTEMARAHCEMDAPPRVTFNQEYESLFHAQVLLDSQLRNEIVDLLLSRSRIWMFMRNTTKAPFYTSDSPATVYSHNDYATGLASPGVEIAIPLSPDLILIIADAKGMNPSDRRRYRKMHKRATDMDDIENVKFYNSLQVIHSYRQVFCQVGDFGLASRMCRENPDVCETDRQRVSMNEIAFGDEAMDPKSPNG